MTDAPLPLLYQDEHLIAVHKPAGLLVHPSSLDAHAADTALQKLRRELGAQAPAFLAPAHRLDKGTSGVLVFACHAEAARALGRCFDQGLADKRYLALVRGWPAEQVQVDHPLARDPELPSQGQPQLPASTDFRRLDRVESPSATDARHPGTRHALVEARPQTGRRHQIRRHLKHISHPLLGDATHGKGPHNRALAQWLGVERLWLHALHLQLPHPDGQQVLRLFAPPGPEWTLLRARGAWLDEAANWPPKAALFPP
jgi:tRNA pseudouridine65 synthase